MMKWLQQRGRFFLLLALVLSTGVGLFGCKGASSPPGPPAEMPAFSLPEDLGIDTSELRTSGSGSLSGIHSPNSLQAIATGGTYSELIDLMGQNAEVIDSFSDVALAVFDGITVTPNPNHVQCTYNSSGGTCINTLTGATDTVTGSKATPVKMDFSDFDLDGDGDTEGCSGSTCPVSSATSTICPDTTPDLPICVRVWVDPDGDGTFTRFIALKVDQIPTDDNQGEGAYRAFLNDLENEAGTLISDVEIGVVYDHNEASDSNAKSTEVFLSSIDYDSSTLEFESDQNIHGLISQESATDAFGESYVEKFLKTYSDTILADNPDQLDSALSNAARWFGEDSNSTHHYWRGTTGLLNDARNDFDNVFTNLCVDLDDGNEVAADDSNATAQCPLLSVATDDDDMINFYGLPADYDFPSITVFPLLPTF
ncbi:MAG: hypothetical protein Q7S00_06705 [bacterium]|nr:hypothetical protein [bacterium]